MRKRVQFETSGNCQVQQHFGLECDINHIVAKHKATGMVTHLARREPVYMDCPSMDYAQAVDVASRAQEGFASLPAKVRDRFKNDPFFLLQWLEDPANSVEAQELGLLPSQRPPERSSEGSAAGQVSKEDLGDESV